MCKDSTKMVKFKQRLDRNKKIYIPKPLRLMGFDNVIEISPDTTAAAIYPEGSDLTEVIQSLEWIIQGLKLAQASNDQSPCARR